MKTGTIILVTWLCVFTVQAQKKIEKHLSFSGKEAIELNIRIADSINIQTWNKNEVYVTASVNINENKDNDAYLTSFEETNNKVVVNANFKDDYFKGRNNCCVESDIYWQVFIPEKAAFSVESINADITITGKTEEMKVKSISGYIDLAIPEKQSAELKFSTISGTIYSNHSMAPAGIKHGSHSAIEGKLNNGGPLIRLETISGDIFFRKSI
jgi:hypothetical protein